MGTEQVTHLGLEYYSEDWKGTRSEGQPSKL